MSLLTETQGHSGIDEAVPVTSKQDLAEIGATLSRVGTFVIRYGLVLVIFWIGAMKFTAYEAQGIQPLVANSPFMGWVYQILSVQGFSNLLGIVEIVIALMVGAWWLSPKVSAIGSLLAMLMFLMTMSFLFSTPGWEPSLGGFPALSVVPGQFLVKDILLFGAAVWSLGESLEQQSKASIVRAYG